MFTLSNETNGFGLTVRDFFFGTIDHLTPGRFDHTNTQTEDEEEKKKEIELS